MNFRSLPENGSPVGHAFEIIVSLTRAQYQLRNPLLHAEFLSGCSSCSGTPSFMFSCFFWDCSCLVFCQFFRDAPTLHFQAITNDNLTQNRC